MKGEEREREEDKMLFLILFRFFLINFSLFVGLIEIDVKAGARPHMIELETMMDSLNKTIQMNEVKLIPENAFTLEATQPEEDSQVWPPHTHTLTRFSTFLFMFASQSQSFDLLFAARKIVDDGLSSLISSM